jgi:GNAT superfamily N-acetyltransferase
MELTRYPTVAAILARFHDPRNAPKIEMADTTDSPGFELFIKKKDKRVASITVKEEFLDDGECYYFSPYKDEPFFEDLCSNEMVIAIEHLAVEPVWRGRGYAEALMTRAMKEIKRKYSGVPITINASPLDNALSLSDLVAFYKRFGFKLLKSYPEHRNALLWKE